MHKKSETRKNPWFKFIVFMENKASLGYIPSLLPLPPLNKQAFAIANKINCKPRG